MTKKDFQLIAQTIKGLALDAEWERVKIAGQFANALETTNPRFKRDLFIQAATGVVPVNARRAVETARKAKTLGQAIADVGASFPREIKRCEGCTPGQFWCGKCDSVEG